MYLEWCKIFKHLGSAISIAFKDINDKGLDFKNNLKLLVHDLKICSPESPEAKFIQNFIQIENSLKI